MTLFYDTETTSLVEFRLPSDHPSQPHLVEIGAILVDTKFNVLDTFHAIVRPMGWVIPQATTRIHGITNEFAAEHGRDEREVLLEFIAFAAKAEKRVAFNEAFDSRIIRIACKRHFPDAVEAWKGMPSACAMRLSQGLLNGKLPTLSAAHIAILRKPMKQQHTAMGDAHACMEVFRALVKPALRSAKATYV